MRTFLLSIFFLSLLTFRANAGVDDFELAVVDPVENLTYPQQILITSDSNVCLLDTVSTSGHAKFFTLGGEFVKGLIPAGAGRNTAKFDLGLTLISGKNVIAECSNSRICLMDNEDGWSVLKIFTSDGILETAVDLGRPVGDADYGAVCADGEKILFEFEDVIHMADVSNPDGYRRFIGNRGEVIQNWDYSNGFLVALCDNEILVYNQSAMPVDTFDVGTILGNPEGFDIYDIAISSKREIAMTGELLTSDGDFKSFLATIAPMSRKVTVIHPAQFIASIDYSKSGTIFSLVNTLQSAYIISFSGSGTSEQIERFLVDLSPPSLANPRQIAVTPDGTIWLDDQYNNGMDSLNPFNKEGDFSLFLKWFTDEQSGECALKNLEENRFASFFLDEISGQIILSGIVLDPDFQPVELPLFSVDASDRKTVFEIHGSDESVIIARNLSENSADRLLSLSPETGEISVMQYSEDCMSPLTEPVNFKLPIDGLPGVCPIDGTKMLIQSLDSPQADFSPISRYEFSTSKISDTWTASENVDLRLLYPCDDKTAVVYWFPQALMRIDEHFNILAYIDLMDDAAYNFIDGCSRADQHYLLDNRYNVVYRFNDSAWQNIENFSLDEVKLSIDFIRDNLAIYFSREQTYPERLENIVYSGILDSDELDKAFEYFLGNSPIFYQGNKYGYVFQIWGKDRDNTLFIVTSKDITEI